MIRSLEFFCKDINGAVDDGIRPVYMWIIHPYAEQGVYHLLPEHIIILSARQADSTAGDFISHTAVCTG